MNYKCVFNWAAADIENKFIFPLQSAVVYSSFFFFFNCLVAHIISLARCRPYIGSASSWSEQSQWFLGSSKCHHSLISPGRLEVVRDKEMPQLLWKWNGKRINRLGLDVPGGSPEPSQVLRLRELELVYTKKKKRIKPVRRTLRQLDAPRQRVFGLQLLV